MAKKILNPAAVIETFRDRVDPFLARDREFEARFGTWKRPTWARRYDLERMKQAVGAFLQAETIEAGFLTLIDYFDQPTAAERRQRQEWLRAEIDAGRRQRHVFQLEAMVEASLVHSRKRLADLLAGRTPEPAFPALGVPPA